MKNKHDPRRRQVLPAALVAAGVLITGTACGDTGVCVDRTDVGIDVTGSNGSDAIMQRYLDDLETVAISTATCAGWMRVEAFTSGATATTTVFDGRLDPGGSTETARARRAADYVVPIMSKIEQAVTESQSSLPQRGSAPMASLLRFSEVRSQLDESQTMRAWLYSDGESNVDVDLSDPNLTEESASALMETVDVPDLTGVELTIAGIGRVVGDQQPSATRLAALKRFWLDVCEASNANSCTVATDLVSEDAR
jgi:hypothetical protein